MRIPLTSDTAQRIKTARLARRRRRAFLVAGVLVCLLFLALWGSSTEAGPVERTLARALTPVMRIEAITAQALTGGTGRFRDLWEAASRLAEVRERNLVLEALLAEKQLVERENRFLRESLGMLASLGVRATPARVIGRNELGTQSLVVDLGENEGIRPFDAVFRPEGAVGYVARTLEHASLILLLTDRNARLGVSIVANASGEMIEGRTHGLPDGNHLLLQTKSPEPIPPQSTVVTSALGTIFFPGLTVGVIEARIPSSSGLFDEYVVSPAVDLHRIAWVLILTQRHRDEAVRLLEVVPGRAGGAP
jgi:rod shape-determining protein MreC